MIDILKEVLKFFLIETLRYLNIMVGNKSGEG